MHKYQQILHRRTQTISMSAENTQDATRFNPSDQLISSIHCKQRLRQHDHQRNYALTFDHLRNP